MALPDSCPGMSDYYCDRVRKGFRGRRINTPRETIGAVGLPVEWPQLQLYAAHWICATLMRSEPSRVETLSKCLPLLDDLNDAG